HPQLAGCCNPFHGGPDHLRRRAGHLFPPRAADHLRRQFMEPLPASRALKITAFIMFVFLLAPVILVFPISFSSDAYMSFPPSCCSTWWYAECLLDTRMLPALWPCLVLAVAVTAMCLLTALPAAYPLARLRFPGSEPLLAL